MMKVWGLGLLLPTVFYAHQLAVPFEFQGLDWQSIITKKKRWNLHAFGYTNRAHHGLQKKNISELFFGPQPFVPVAAHYKQLPDVLFPFADQAMKINCSWREHGLVFTGGFSHDINDTWACGVELAIPLKSIAVDNHSIDTNDQLVNQGLTKESVFIESNNPIANDFALNCAFALQLPANCTPLGLQFPLINLQNEAYGQQPTCGSVLLTEDLFNQIDQNPLTLVYQSTAPTPSFSLPIGLGNNPGFNTARGLAVLEGNGLVNGQALTEGMRVRFASNQDYGELPGSIIKNLWLVPSVTDGQSPVLTNRALAAYKSITSALRCLATCAQDQLSRAHLSFKSTVCHGIGDTAVRVYASHRHKDLLTRVVTGFIFPSAKKLDKKEILSLFASELGSGGHTQYFIACESDMRINQYISMAFKGGWNSVLPACEERKASFVGARLKNMGPITQADVSWNTFSFDSGLQLSAPEVMGLVAVLRCEYQAFYKTKEKVSYRYHQAYDWADGLQTVSSEVASSNSEFLAHTIRILCGLIYKDNCFDIGWHAVVGGFNTIKSHGIKAAIRIRF